MTEECLICVSRKEFPSEDLAKHEACRYCMAGVKRATKAIALGIRKTSWPEHRWYVTVKVYKKGSGGEDTP